MLGSSSNLHSVAEPELDPEPVEPKFFVVPEPLLAILAPAPRLRSQNYLFNKYFTIMRQFGGCRNK